MAPERDQSDRLSGRIDDCKSAVAISDPDVAGLSIIPHVIGVITEIQRLSQTERFSIVDSKLAVSSCSNVETATLRIKVDALWFFESFDLGNAFSSILADAGASVVVADVDPDGLKSAVAELSAKLVRSSSPT